MLAACLGPFVRLGVQYLLYKLTAFLAGDDRRSGAGEADRCAGWRVRPDAGYDRQPRPVAAHLHLLGHSGGDAMMEMLQGWPLGLTAAALAVSLLTAMLPRGETIRRIAGLAGGLILLLAVVQPLLRVRWEELTWRYETYQREMDRQTEAYQAAYADSLSGDIADRTAAYISEKAASLGIDCRVQVEVRTEDGLPLPYGGVAGRGKGSGAVGLHGAGAGIPASRQSWQPEE